MTTVGIIGLGQIGGSLALGLVAQGIPVIGTDTDPSTCDAAKRFGIEISLGLDFLVDSCAIIFVCVSINANRKILDDVLARVATLSVKPTVTDVASYKKGTFTPTENGNCTFLIPGHPMAGTHGSSFTSADPNLFSHAEWILIVDGAIEVDRFLPLIKIITTLGARVQFCSVTWHDECVSLISALPHVLAVALGKVSTESADSAEKMTVAAGSFRSATRVLQSNPDFLRELLLLNRPTLIPLIQQMKNVLDEIERELISEDDAGLDQMIHDAVRSVEPWASDSRSTIQQVIPIGAVEPFIQSLRNTGTSVIRIEHHQTSVRITTQRPCKPNSEY